MLAQVMLHTASICISAQGMQAFRGELFEDVAHIALAEGHDLPTRWCHMHCTASSPAISTLLNR